MRDEEQRAGQAHDTHARRTDASTGRRFARRLDCGGDVVARDAAGGPGSSAAWPAARAAGVPREGDDDRVDAPDHA
jgi:hypothetical protein